MLCDLAITILILRATTMADLIEVTGFGQIRPGAGSRFVIADKEMAIFNVDGKICAISDTCPHAGGSLGMGKLNGRIVTCPLHGMKFDVTIGCFAGTSDFGVAAYPAKIVDGKIMVSIS
jgi:nitrite reductase/ring-hydroxylating ferredoxin subunit